MGFFGWMSMKKVVLLTFMLSLNIKAQLIFFATKHKHGDKFEVNEAKCGVGNDRKQ
jgi:hypothetical protein